MDSASTSTELENAAGAQGRYAQLYARSVNQPEAFWAEQAQRIHWQVAPKKILDASNPPFRKWFVGGQTNL